MDFATKEYAKQRDNQDPLRRFREYFIIPSKADLARKTARPSPSEKDESEASTYLCGNSLGLQPKLTQKYFQQYSKHGLPKAFTVISRKSMTRT